MSQIDLHLHSNCSDGTLSPKDLVLAAQKADLKVIALTDHDIVDGIEEAITTGKDLGIRVIPGVEINTDYGEHDVHILGYLVNYKDSNFLKILQNLREQRLSRNEKILELLKGQGIDIPMEDVLRIAGKTASPGRPHIARALMKRGLVSSVQEAFDKYLGRGSSAYVSRAGFSPREAVKTILGANGVPVIAHPGKLGVSGLVPELVKEGLMGLEIYYPDHSSFMRDQLHKVAERYGLLFTGGTDWHGPGMERKAEIGSEDVPSSVIESLDRAHLEVIQKGKSRA